MMRENDQLAADPRWTVEDTGGGCTALTRRVSEEPKATNGQWLITRVDDAEAPHDLDEPVTLGLYVDADCVGMWGCGVRAGPALAIANGMRG